MNTEPPDKHRSIKNALKDVIKDAKSQGIILDVVHACHRITVHTLQFLKLYLLTCYEGGSTILEVTGHFAVAIMNVICEESNGVRRRTI